MPPIQRTQPVYESHITRSSRPRMELPEVLERLEPKTVDDDNALKVEINTFIWMHAPSDMPLGKADELACKVFELFIEARKQYGK